MFLPVKPVILDLKKKTSHLLGIFITSGYFRENPKIKMTSTLYLQLLKEAGDVI